MEMGPCIYCRRTEGPFVSREHPLPEGLGNKEIMLPRGVVCDPCNNGPLARLDDTLLNFAPVASLRVFQGVPTKSGGYPHARFSNVHLAQVGPSDLHLVSQSGKRSIREQPGGFRVEMAGRRLTPRYLANLARFMHKATLGLMFLDHGRKYVLDPRFDEIRRIVGGADFEGYLLLCKAMGEPTPEVRFTYDPFVAIEGKETVMAWIDVHGFWMATDLLVRQPNDLDPRVEEQMALLRFNSAA